MEPKDQSAQLLQGGGTVLSALLLIVSATLAVMAISEIGVRQELCKLVDERTHYLLDSSGPLPPEAWRRAANPQDPASQAEAEVSKLQHLHSELQALIILGANRERTSALIADQFLNKKNHLPLSYFNFLTQYSSDFILAFALACCGLCGAVVADLRTNKQQPDFRHVLLGLAAGFITLLSLKGGKAIFLVEHRADLIVFNPYSSALLALLAGLYAKLAFRLLTALVRVAELSVERHGLAGDPGVHKPHQPPAPAAAAPLSPIVTP